MPYIRQEERDGLNYHLGELNIRTAGQLNYAITVLCRDYLAGKRSYTNFNEVIGVLECAKQELYRTQMAPYEDEKRFQNGDVFNPEGS